MNQAITLKAQAANLVAAMAEMGIKMSKSQGLEAIAKQYGVANWDTLNGMLKAKPEATRAPVLADMPGYPDCIVVERGPHRTFYRVESYDEEALALLHDEKALRAHLEKNLENYDEGLDTTAISVQGDGESLAFTFNQLLGMTYQKLGGMGTWWLNDNDTILSFICGDSWNPEEGGQVKPVQLPAIPQMAKSAKGVKVLQLPSHDGAQYDLFFVVPPHLDIEVITKKLGAEIERLKQQDRDNEDNPEYDEYDADDVKAFAKTLGIEPCEPNMGNDNWDC